jgi:hypothetical protein
VGIILFKTAVAVAVTCLAFPALRLAAPTRSDAAFISRAVALQMFVALTLYLVIYVIGRQEVPSDVPAFYLPAARQVLAGYVPFRDFPLSYGPLFPYVGAALVRIWDSGKSFCLFAIVMNAIALVAWHRAALHATDPQTARQASILYATNGHLAYQSLLGTNQVWICAGLAMSSWLLFRNRSLQSGFVQVVSAATTKFLALLFWPVLCMCAPVRLRWLMGAFVLFAVYAAFAFAGGDILYPFRHEGELLTSGNLPYLLAPLLQTVGLTSPLLLNGAALGILLIANLWFFTRVAQLAAMRRPTLVFAGLALLGSLFMLVSKKSYTGYAVFFMYPATLMLLSGLRRPRTSLYFLFVFNTLLVIEPTLWFRFGGNGRTLLEWIPELGLFPASAFLASEVALLGCYLFLVILSIRRVTESSPAPFKLCGQFPHRRSTPLTP